LNFVGNKVICVCVQVRVSCATDTYLSSLESYWRQTLVSLLREIFCYATSHLPLGVYQRRARNHYHHLAHQTLETRSRERPDPELYVDSPGATRIFSLLALGTYHFGSLGTKS